jgi:DNA-binding transcriptional ArsR family regulator
VIDPDPSITASVFPASGRLGQVTVTLVLGADPGVAVTFGTSPLAELTAALHALVEPGHHPVQRMWVNRVSGAIEPELRERIDAFSPLWTMYRARYLLPGPEGLNRSLRDELASIQRLDDDQFTLFTAWAISGGYTGRALESVTTRDSAQDELRRRAAARGQASVAMCDRFLTDHVRFRAELLDTLNRSATSFFAREWGLVSKDLADAARAYRGTARTQGMTAALQAVSAPSSLLSRPDRIQIDQLHRGTITLDKQKLLVMPSALGRPHRLIKHEGDWPAILQCPLPAGATDEPMYLAVIRQRLAVFSDPTKLAIARGLAHEPLPTIELARRLGCTPPQMSRHLRTMRETHLVTVTRRGNYVLYQLDLAQVARLGPDLLDALLR